MRRAVYLYQKWLWQGSGRANREGRDRTGQVDAQQVVERGGGINKCCVGGITALYWVAVSFSWVYAAVASQDLLRLNPPSLLMLFGCVSISMASKTQTPGNYPKENILLILTYFCFILGKPAPHCLRQLLGVEVFALPTWYMMVTPEMENTYLQCDIAVSTMSGHFQHHHLITERSNFCWLIFWCHILTQTVCFDGLYTLIHYISPLCCLFTYSLNFNWISIWYNE